MKIRKYIPLVILIAGAFVLARYFNIALLKGILDRYDKFGFAICILSYVVLSVTVIPSDPITLLVIAWKGPMVAVVLATIGNTLAAMVEFYVGKSIGDVADFEEKKASLPFHLGQMPVNSPMCLIFARLLTSYGSKLVSLAAGIYHVPMVTYLWTTLVANLIGTIVTVAGGYGLINLFLKLP